MLACVFAAVLLAVPTVALALDFTPNAWLDDDGVLHWDAEGEYYSGIDLYPLMFGPNSDDSCMPPVNGEYSYDIENLFQAAEQFYPIAGSIDGLNGSHPVAFVYYERRADGSMEEVGRAENAYSYTYATGKLVKLSTPDNLTWTGDDGFTASWDSVEYVGEYRVNFYETVSGSTSEVGGTYVEGTTCELTSVVDTPKDGATYTFDVRAWGPEENYEYCASDTSAKSAESAVWETPIVDYHLTVGGIDVTSENAADVLGDGAVSYDSDSRTLTLKNAKITNTNVADRSIEVDPGVTLPLTIALEGTNSCGPIMAQKGTVTISGSGSLTVTQNLSVFGATGISVQDDLVIDGVKLTVNSNESAIQSNSGNITIKNGAQVEASAQGEKAYLALSAGAGVTVTGANTSVKVSTDDSYGNYPLISHSGVVTIEDGAYVESSGMAWSDGDFKVSGEGTLLVASTEAPNNGYAVNCLGHLTVEKGAVLESKATVYSTRGISVTGGSTLDVDAQSYENGLAIEIGGSPNTSGNIVVTGSTLIAKSQGDAVYGFWDKDKNSSFSATDSTVSLCSSAGYALLLGRDVTLSGGTITLEGAQGAIYVDNGTVDFGSDPTWYQWATSPAGAVKLSATEPYVYADDTSTYLRFEPAGTTYKLTVNGGQGGGSYAAGTQAVITAEASNADGHFAGWSVTEDPTGAGTLANAEAASTTFTMPAANVTLTASYEAHTFSNGACTVCGEKDPGYVPPTPPHNPPASSGPDWEDVTSDITNAESGDRVVVDMEGETELPGEVLEALAGSDVTLVLEMGDGVAWEIAGAGVPEDTSFSATDLGVSMGTSGIPVDVTNLVTGEHGTVQVTLSHEGDFGFELALVAPLGEKNEGLYANLYHYDDAEKLLRFGSFGVVGEDGTVRLALTRASQLAIAIDVRGHELPFSDAGEGKWYSEPVRWAWLSGAMTGYGDGSGLFGPADPLSRAQLAVVLWRLAGEPAGEAALPADCGTGEFYAEAVSWALGTGIFSGYESGLYGPADALTREQAATVLWRAAGSPEAECDLSAYPDAGGVSGFASSAMRWAVSEGVISGREPEPGALVLDPQGTCSRAELAALMMRLSAE